MTKPEARQWGQAVRTAMTPAVRAAASGRIVAACQAQLDWPHYRRVSLFRPWLERGEVDLRPLEAWLTQAWPQIAVRAEPMAAFQDDRIAFDLILVPLLAFDPAGQRVGYGRGYYDRFLATQPQAQWVGIAYDAQRVAAGIATEAHDQLLRHIITEASGDGARLDAE